MKKKIDFTPKKKNKSTSSLGEKLFLISALLLTFFIITMNTQENFGTSVATTSLGQGLSFLNKLKSTDFTPSLTGAATTSTPPSQPLRYLQLKLLNHPLLIQNNLPPLL